MDDRRLHEIRCVILEFLPWVLVLAVICVLNALRPVDPRPGDIQVGAPDAGHRATSFLFYAAPPASTPPPPHLCVALLDAGQACLDADTVDQAYRQLFDAVLASPHGFHRRNR